MACWKTKGQNLRLRLAPSILIAIHTSSNRSIQQLSGYEAKALYALQTSDTINPRTVLDSMADKNSEFRGWKSKNRKENPGTGLFVKKFGFLFWI